jgi:hypothetical protein
VLWFDRYDPNVVTPDERTIKEMINTSTKEYLVSYLINYNSFIDDNNVKDITLPNPVNRPDEIQVESISWDDGPVSIKFQDISFIGKRDILKITRTFKPSGRVRIELKRVWDLTNTFITTDEIGQKSSAKISTEITNENDCTVDNVKNKVNDVLNDEIVTPFNNDDVKLFLTLEDTEASPVLNSDESFNSCQFKITVKVRMVDKKYSYPVYDGSRIIEDNLGFVYRIRTGN